MAETQSPPAVATNRPKPLHLSRSFSRMADRMAERQAESPGSPSRKRASTLQEAGIPAVPEARAEVERQSAMADVFESHEEDQHEPQQDGASTPGLNVPSTMDELPIEIRTLCDRFLDSLSAKVHPTPLNADQLSELFQDFYERAANHIATHIATLAARIGRATPPAQTRTGKGRQRSGSGAKRAAQDDAAGHAEMLTASEVTDRKKARKLLEHKRLALQEAVERAVCEKIYDKIWKHRSTDDEARDDKLRSRTQALSVVGIGLKELHMDKPDVRHVAEEKEDEINSSLAPAREALQRMDDDHYPLGKLHHLTVAHQAIVETLSQVFPSSSSADEILPTLIYTLITCPSDGINVVSNLAFIQRFRMSSKVDGEAAYCLVNLEAAISFLETVDLSSLRSDELPQGPDAKPHSMSSRSSTPHLESPTSIIQPKTAHTVAPDVSTVNATSSEMSTSAESAAKSLPAAVLAAPAPTRPEMQQRRISSMIATTSARVDTGRQDFLNAADKLYDSVNGTLDNSMQFLFGRFKEQVADSRSSLPKTLEDARRLVSSPISGPDDDDSLRLSGRSSPAHADPLSAGGSLLEPNRMLELLGGKKAVRDRSVDSTKSGGSGRRAVTFDGKSAAGAAAGERSGQQPTTPSGLFNSINPLNKFGMPAFVPRFGRAGSVNSAAQPTAPQLDTKISALPVGAAAAQGRLNGIVESPVSMRKPSDTLAAPMPALERTRSRDSTTGLGDGDDMNARESLAELKKLKPPKKRFLEIESANQLKLGEIEELLLEYRRLAKAIGEAIAN
ncbi:Putative vacuolar protein sorting-associated protein [Septoria linicola]|uniref:Vacuolar protein sorting-associated protein n=1 Tax=Septoria linicola TaxID=215465 RepID=A0A9Q9ELK3_9PEZI|nr:putative vacuolar protein sorting-associated protein [Septoria linicola]USW55170.1 Putative vacuolar protein sorting-associated protein [Septoria linicola]